MEKVEEQSEDDLTFNPKTVGFRDVVMSHFNKCVSLMSVEFRGGYYTMVPTKDTGEKEVYISDTREIYSNAVYALALMLQPKFDKDMKKCYDKFKIELQNIKTNFLKITNSKSDIILGDSYYISEEEKLALETYRQYKLALFLDLFSDISLLLGRKNYLTIGGVDY
jgi:hypothetical protein